MYPLYTTLVLGLIYLLIALTLTVSAIRLMWIAGSYLKCKQDQLSKDPANQS